MQLQPSISFVGIDPSPAVEDVIRERVERLERFSDRITSCSVVVEAPHRHGHQGKIYHVHVDITLPGTEIVAGRDPERNHAHEDVYVAIRDSFNAAQRQLEDVVRKMSGHRDKPHPPHLSGTVVRIMPEDGYGFIEAADGTELYFGRESVTSDAAWRDLSAGCRVRFTARDGEKGPYATAVTRA